MMDFPDIHEASTSFDPYYHWLGIPPSKQPPNHYCLLGIELFESSPTVIENAADQRMGHLRRHQTGPHSLQSQELLNKVATAKICLLQPEKKAEYDVTLRERLSVTATDRHDDFGGSFPHTLYDFVSASDYGGHARKRLNQSRHRSRIRRMILLNMFGFSVMVIAAIGIQPNSPLGQYLRTQMSPTQATRPAPARSSKPLEVVPTPRTASKQPSLNTAPSLRSIIVGADVSRTQPTPLANQGSFTISSTDQTDLSVSPPAISMDALNKAGVSPEVVSKQERMNTPSKAVKDDKTLSSPRTIKDSPPKTSEAIRVKPLQRLPVPPQADQQKASEELQEVCGETSSMTSIDKVRLVGELIEMSEKVSKNAAERFVLLRRASEMAGEAGDIRRMAEAIDMLTAQYDLDGWNVKQKLLERLLRNASTEQTGPLIRGTRLLIDQAVAVKCYHTAIELAKLALSASQQKPNHELRREIQEQLLQLQRSEKQQQQVEEAEALLRRDSSNEEANLAVGRWHCLARNDWEKGLPFLAKGSDEELRLLSQQELRHSPSTTEAQIKLGDAWWRLAQDRPKEDKKALMLRAGYWYECCMELDAGITKTRVAKRLKEISRLRQTVNATSEEQATVSREAARRLWTDIL